MLGEASVPWLLRLLGKLPLQPSGRSAQTGRPRPRAGQVAGHAVLVLRLLGLLGLVLALLALPLRLLRLRAWQPSLDSAPGQ